MTTRRAGRVLFVFFVLNALLLFVVAMSNSKFRASEHRTSDDTVRFAILVLAESVLLLLPGLILGLVLAKASPLAGELVGLCAIAFVTPWYYIDFLLHRVFGLRLIVPKAWELVWPVLERAGDFTLQSKAQTVLIPIALFISFESMAYWSARSSWRLPMGLLSPTAWCTAIMVLVVFFLSATRVVTAPSLRILFMPNTDPHPIHVTSIFDKSRFRFRSLSVLEHRCVAGLVAASSNWDQVEKRYRNMGVKKAPAARPDVVLIIVESLRSDALSAESAPNLHRFAERAAVARQHYSAGNATHLGYFGIMYGLNALWADRAIGSNLPPALPSLMKQMGYHRALLGSWSIEHWHGMDQFLNRKTFDQVEMMPLGKSYMDGDRQVVQQARAMLDRSGPYAELRDQPLFLVVQINATHYEYHCDPEDQIFQPITALNPPWTEADRPLVANRYRNSVHGMDRTIAPLLDPECVVVFAGDHGESFGEDGFFLHCSALSPVQVQTPFLIAAPHRAPQSFPGRTSHFDVLPTLLDVLGTEVDDPACLHGRSMFDTTSDNSSIPIVFGESRGESWVVIERANGGEDQQKSYRFACDPFSARFRLEGIAEPRNWSVQPDQSGDDEFLHVFERMAKQLCAGVAPEIPDDAYASLLNLLAHNDNRVRYLAIQGLAEMSDTASETIPMLRRLLKDDEPMIRIAAATALSKLKRFE